MDSEPKKGVPEDAFSFTAMQQTNAISVWYPQDWGRRGPKPTVISSA